MFWTPKWKRDNKQQIKLYQSVAKDIGDEYDAKVKPRDGRKIEFEDSQKAFDAYNEQIMPVMNKLVHHRQVELLHRLDNSPLQVPDEYWFDTKVPYQRVLYPKGVAWVEHELKKIRNAEIEFWFKLVVPVLSLILSIIALVRSGRSH